MAKQKKNYSVTSRYFSEKSPEFVHSAHDVIYLAGDPFRRLSFGPIRGKQPVTSWDLANWIDATLPDNTIFFPDTNFFSKEMSRLVLKALLRKRIAITPMVLQEIQPWLATPHHNRWLRDIVLEALRRRPQDPISQILEFDPAASWHDRIVFLDLTPHFLEFGYQYYFNLLSLRRLISLEIATEMSVRSGMQADRADVIRELQRRYGDRGFRLAKEALERSNSPTFLADEQLVVMAAISAICTGHSTALLTWDTAIQEQFVKLDHLLVEDFVAHRAAEWAATGDNLREFREMKKEGSKTDICAGDSALVAEFYKEEFEAGILPKPFDPVRTSCIVIGGDATNMVCSRWGFCAERGMAQLLITKSQTGGKNTPHFGDVDCMATQTLRHSGRLIDLIILLEPQMTTCCSVPVSIIDRNAALMTSERVFRFEQSRIVLP